jgi:hypothetical protein
MNRTIATVALLALATPALAETPSFNFFQAGYVDVEIDFGEGFDVDGDGFDVGGAFEIGDNFFGFAIYRDIGLDFGIDVSTLQIGFGYHTGLSDNTSFFFRAGYAEADASLSGFGSEDESGYVAYADLGDDADDTTVGGQIWFNITDNFALGANISAGDDVTSYGAGLRFYFGD